VGNTGQGTEAVILALQKITTQVRARDAAWIIGFVLIHLYLKGKIISV